MRLAARIDATLIRFAVVGAITTAIDFVLFGLTAAYRTAGAGEHHFVLLRYDDELPA